MGEQENAAQIKISTLQQSKVRTTQENPDTRDRYREPPPSAPAGKQLFLSPAAALILHNPLVPPGRGREDKHELWQKAAGS